MNNRGSSIAGLLIVIVLIFVLITAGMYFLLPRKEVEVKIVKEEIEKKILKYSPTEIEEMNMAIREREALLAEKEKIVQKQEEHIKLLNQELEKIKEEVSGYQDLITKTVVQVLTAEKKNIKKLAKVFELMSPEEAVPIIKKLDDETVVGVLVSMKERSSAKVLGAYAATGEVHAERVARVSEMLKKLTSSTPVVP